MLRLSATWVANPGGHAMIYRRDTRNRSLDDFTEARPKAGPRAGRRPERAPRADSAPQLSQATPALAASVAVK